MKKYMVILPLSAITLFVSLPQKADAQVAIAEVIQAGIKKVIRAVDLKVQRLQNQTIWLQNAQKVLENQLSRLRLTEIAAWTEKQKALYSEYYEELWNIKTAIAYYHGIRELSTRQTAMIREYRNTWQIIAGDAHFSVAEREHMERVYKGILEAAMKNIDQVLLISAAGKTQMSDAERLDIIQQANEAIGNNYQDLKQFNRQNAQLSINRARDVSEIDELRTLYGLHEN
ncbi:MAG: conjugal transfer protein TraI [Mucilaginibacter polytrichastri]|nr:conjugal transfer protein TraI [Mucilaginibacter polytrichastri]